jgi:hypothetical protein
MRGKIALTVVGLVGAICAAILLRYGTLDPCGMLRVQVREQRAREGQLAGSLAAILPDAALDAVIQAAYGPLTPGQCLGLLFNPDQRRTVPPSATAQTPFRSNTPGSVPQQGQGRYVGSTCYMTECFHQDVLKIEKGANDVVTVWVRNRKYDGRQPQVPLGDSTMMYHAVCRMPGGYIEVDPSRRVAEPNPQPSHMTEPDDRIWTYACSHSG